jgi:hypothetical protein
VKNIHERAWEVFLKRLPGEFLTEYNASWFVVKILESYRIAKLFESTKKEEEEKSREKD